MFCWHSPQFERLPQVVTMPTFSHQLLWSMVVWAATCTVLGDGGPLCTQELETDFLANDYAKFADGVQVNELTVANTQECADKCYWHETCLMYTHWNTRCYMKTSDVGRQTKSNAISGICKYLRHGFLIDLKPCNPAIPPTCSMLTRVLFITILPHC